ncbi:membrane associated signal transduction histidine kinase and receiver domain [Wolbachia endosymbiont of Armadillidium vulgare str. wVulC]|uniref:ATP-binding protein n=1 Tax=Wolbachia endosymbiont of Armadillidium vulgare TaxID=77039 RepID=UPI00064B5188|nr:ATP-binding protein [Wolbachia endosymbiont of Armadillidium vulgare]KLT23332.1 membrane associated signal transduction histidine kinase and receiver domain [Wolbachia endosymbiont of Armadillidium vulgare str. wVulC]
MSKRYIDNEKENRVDFILRNYGMSIIVIAAIMLLPPIAISVLYFSNVYSQHVNIEINLLISTLMALFVVYNIKRYKYLLNIIEFQNAIFANALNHNTEFCLILYKDEGIFYADARFYERFKDHVDDDVTLDKILEAGDVSEKDRKSLYHALKNNTSVKVCISLSKKNRISNFLLLSEPIPDNPQIAINSNKILNLSLSPIARPDGYFVLKATQVNKEQVYEELIEKHNIATYVANTKGVILSVNKRFLDVFELKKLEKGSSINDFISQSKYDDTITENEIMFFTISGAPFKAYMSTTIFCDKYNHSYIHGFITPTESNIVDYQLHPCFANSSIAIAQCDVNGNFIKKNIALVKLAGPNNDSIFALILDNYHTKVREYFSSNRVNNASFDVQLNAGNNMKIYFNKFLHNKVMFILCYFIDNTERKKLEIKLEHYQKVQAIGQLAGSIAHDFNNILTGIIGFCDLLLLQHSASDPSFGDIIQIQQNAKRGSNLVRQLLAFSRRQTLQPKIIDVNSTIANLYEMIKRLIGENIKFNIYYGRDLGAVRADQGQLEQVILNLAVNASAAMEKGGELTILTFNKKIDSLNSTSQDMFSPDKETIEHGNYVVIEVIDTGCGITSDTIGKVFDPFFSTKDITSGTGLGLSTVYGIIKQTEGYIYVASKVNHGTKFSIFLPMIYISDENLRESDSEEIERPVISEIKGNGIILLIEDEGSVREPIARALKRKGFDVIEASMGSKALEIISKKSQHIDLIITDVIMPEVSGPEIVKEALIHRPNINVIFISGYAEDAFLKSDDINIEDFHFLPKPFTLNELGNKVQNVLHKIKKGSLL